MSIVHNLMIVDNSKVALKSMEQIFVDCPFKVHSFSDPHKALEEMDEISPDIILLDYFMPEMTVA